MQTVRAADVEAYVASMVKGRMRVGERVAMRALEAAAGELDVRSADLAALVVAASSLMPTDQSPGPGADTLVNQPGTDLREAGRGS